jgi:hypothetical protein
MARGACKYAAMWAGVSFFFLRGEEKNKINSLKFALSCQRAKILF